MDAPHPAQAGFTLIELMVVLVIVGIASAAISLSIRPDPLQLLRKDAERLAQAIQVAQAEARADGRPILWLSDSKGYKFIRTDGQGGKEQFNGDAQLRPTRWQSTPMQVQLDRGKTLVLDAEWIAPPMRLSLSDGQHSIGVVRSANGEVRVQ
ncbi:type II secretion system minor pseudopilin GspH [Pseudomonas vanderleydeniana]|uniref:Type II secretion system protein H n=1 Tax=Pseudomonas vanderleydeniana TaxID=2745495 RepID=A0A9E6TPZ8_9PSED|nr:type II secretion system minor pseudopilin GspH [Pseudomonas vanderleydeniana]QXI25917.1 type II secretion system minor pseudopilin GspH [Pseudomonas vanderleydeniana]